MLVRPAILPGNHMRVAEIPGLTTGWPVVCQSDVDFDHDPKFTAMHSAVGFPQREQCFASSVQLEQLG